MENKWIIPCILSFFALLAIGSHQLEQFPSFSKLKTALQDKTVAGGILNYGAMGKVLKQSGMIKTVPQDAVRLPGMAKKQSIIRILLEVDIDTDLQIFWATKKRNYSTEHFSSIPISAGNKEYAISIPVLSAIDRLRIDPAMEQADISINRIIIEQADREDIRLTSAAGLEHVKPLNGISNLIYTAAGMSFRTINKDAQLELQLEDVKKTSKIEVHAFPRKRQETRYLHTANPGGLNSFPSSKIIKEEHFKKNWPIVSLVVEENDLYHPDTGIIPNKASRGRQWERPAYFSYFDENGQLLFASMAGVRIHGGKRLQLYSSYRLYFRKEYGLSRFTEFRPKIKFSEKAEPVKRLIVHHTAWPEGGWFFNNTLAYDIARRIGCVVPETRLALLYINGVEQGMFFLVPHLGDDLLSSYFGHNNFVFYKEKSENSQESFAFNIDKFWRVVSSKDKLTMKEVGKHIDLDNLTRHMFSFVFCGTSDYFQGVKVLDNSKPDNKLFWINWDMDQSFINMSKDKGNKPNWQQSGWDLVYRQDNQYSGRTILFTTLLDEDPEYRNYVISLSMDLLNHRLSEAFLTSRLQYYNTMLINYGIKDSDYMKMLGVFVKNRPAFIRGEMEKIFNLEPAVLCSIKGSANLEYQIDGYRESSNYQGYYFKGSQIRVTITSAHKKSFSHWLVNGKKIKDASLNLKVQSESIIEPVFKNF